MSPLRCPFCSRETEDSGQFCQYCGKRIVPGRNQSRILTIGRSPDNDIVIPNDHVSRLHARISVEGDNFILEDAGSRNGVYVNGFKIQIQPITAQDTVTLGSSVQLYYEQLIQAAGRKGYLDLNNANTMASGPGGFIPPPAMQPGRQPVPLQYPAQPPVPNKNRPDYQNVRDFLSVKDWLITLLLASVPVLNFILLYQWSQDTNQPSKAEWAKVYIIFMAAMYVLGILYVVFGYAAMMTMIRGY